MELYCSHCKVLLTNKVDYKKHTEYHRTKSSKPPCDCDNEAQVRITVTKLDGEVIDSYELCGFCAIDMIDCSGYCKTQLRELAEKLPEPGAYE